ncbi:MAG: nuclear transport factor 2 family protein [Pseudomonadales bacterium]
MKKVATDKSTIDRSIKQLADRDSAIVVIDVCSGETGTMADWVVAFSEAWHAPAQPDRIVALLDDNITLRAPIKPPVTRGKEAARAGFERVFNAIPDLRGDVHRWGCNGDTVFIEMSFHATVGGKPISWRNVDRILFKDGVAIERVAYFDPSTLRRALTGSLRGMTQLWRLRRG